MRAKALLLFALVLCGWFPALGFAAPARVQGITNSTGNNTSLSVTLPSASTTGNTVVGCVVQGTGANPTSITDGTNTYTQINGPSFAGSQGTLFYKINVTGTSSPIVASFTTGSGAYMVAEEFSGISTSAAIDGSATGTANNTTGTNTFSSGNLSPTPTHNGDLIWGCMSSLNGTGTFVAGTTPNFTFGTTSTANNAYSEYLIQATAAAIAAAFSETGGSGQYGWIEGVAFVAGGGGGGPVAHLRMLMDVGQ